MAHGKRKRQASAAFAQGGASRAGVAHDWEKDEEELELEEKLFGRSRPNKAGGRGQAGWGGPKREQGGRGEEQELGELGDDEVRCSPCTAESRRAMSLSLSVC